MEAWDGEKVETDEGWKATIFVAGHGGDCMYVYTWEGEIKGGPMAGPLYFDVYGATYSDQIIGTVTVTSAGETIKKSLFIIKPDD